MCFSADAVHFFLPSPSGAATQEGDQRVSKKKKKGSDGALGEILIQGGSGATTKVHYILWEHTDKVLSGVDCMSLKSIPSSVSPMSSSEA